MLPGLWWAAKRTVAYGWKVLHTQAALHPEFRWVLDIGKGTFVLPGYTLMSTLSHLTIRGKGADHTHLRGKGDGDWQLWFEGSSFLCLEDLHLDVDTCTEDASCVTLAGVSRACVTRVRFSPLQFWGLRIQGGTTRETAGRSSKVKVSHCAFAEHRPTATTEALVALNTEDLDVSDCTFIGMDGTAIGLGLYLDVIDAWVTRCTFAGTRMGAYFGVSVKDLDFVDCGFETRNGIQGGNRADDEPDTTARANDVRVSRCTFTSPISGEEGNGLTLYAADDVRVHGCTFTRYNSIPIVIGAPRETEEGSGVYEPQPAPKGITVAGCTFACTVEGDSWRLHPEILVQHVDEDINLRVENCMFKTSRQAFWVALSIYVTADRLNQEAEPKPQNFADKLNIALTNNTLNGPPPDGSTPEGGPNLKAVVDNASGYTVLESITAGEEPSGCP